MMKKIIILWFVTLLLAQQGNGQSPKDTVALIKEFNKVMAFALRPYLHYNMNTSVDAMPVMNDNDTLRMKGEFFKNGDNVYYNDGKDEIYLEDGYFVQINTDRRTIWISKADENTSKRLNIMPLNDKDLQQLLRRNYNINKEIIGSETASLHFETRQAFGEAAGMTTHIGIRYNEKSYFPENISIEIRMQEPAADELIAMLRREGIDEKPLIQVIDNVRYIIRKQRVNVAFVDIDTTHEKAMQIPTWKDKLVYDGTRGEFTGKGIYQEYEVTKTF